VVAVGSHLPEYTAPRPEHNNFHCATQRNSSFIYFCLFQLSTANVNNNTVDRSHNNVNTSPTQSGMLLPLYFCSSF